MKKKRRFVIYYPPGPGRDRATLALALLSLADNDSSSVTFDDAWSAVKWLDALDPGWDCEIINEVQYNGP